MKIFGINHKTIAIFGILFSALSYVVLTVAVKYMDYAFSPGLAVALRLNLALVFIYILMWRGIDLKKIVSFKLSTWIYFILFGFVGGTVAIYLLSIGTLKSSVLVVSVLLALAPVWTYFLRLFTRISKFNWKILTLAIMSFLGVLVISYGMHGDKLFQFVQVDGFVYVVIASFLMSLFYAFREKLPENLNNQEITFFIILISAITSNLLVWLEFANGSFTLKTDMIFDSRVSISLFLGGVLNVTGGLIAAYSFKHIDAVLGTQLLLSENIFALVLGYILFGETINNIQILGVLIIVLSAYLVSVELEAGEEENFVPTITI